MGGQMTCYVMLEFTAKKGTGNALLEVLRGALPATRSKDGCQSLDLVVNQDKADNMIIVMRWQSRKHYETYRAWREANGDVKQFADATEGGLSTRYFDITGA
jgi:quinol monooxygenase YgiN